MDNMNFKKSISKEEIATLPREVFSGRIVVVNTNEELSDALSYLSTCPEIGFDTETRPSFIKHIRNKMSLIQLSDKDTCFLIRLNKLNGIPRTLVSFLKNKEIIKIGLSLRDDFIGLPCLNNDSTEGFIDLQRFVPHFGIEDMSLQKIYAILFGKRIPKSQKKSNWDNVILTEAQKRYAALDAWSCLRIYQYLKQSQ